MKYLGLSISLFIVLTGFAQYGEEVGPMMGNPALMAKSSSNNLIAKNSGTFDSTFIYTSDTISLPVFDDFSSDKFQKYNANFGDEDSSIVYYRLLDAGSQPLSAGYTGTQLPTFRHVYNEETGMPTYEYFDTTQVQMGDLSSYPVVYNTVNSHPPFFIYDTIAFTGGTDPDPDTLWIQGPEIYQDSARQFFVSINDPNAIWLDDEVYRNSSMAWNPWSYGVATFDGLDERGYPYAINTTTTNYADHLTSKPIDMSAMTPVDSVYFSFMFQAQGVADPPESGDSLILQFYSSSLQNWNNVWSTSGIDLDTFRVGHVLIDDPNYLTNAFQFRFVNYGGLSGSLDHWHVDYVHLRSVPGFGGAADTFPRDIAFSYPVYSLLKDYTAVPWDHYKNLSAPNYVMSDAVNVVMANSFPTEIGANDGAINVNHGGGPEGSALLVSDIICNNVNDNYFALDITYSVHDVQSSYTFDQSKTGISQEFEIVSVATGGATNFPGNDSVISYQKFENFYSYDDGSAEAAYGPTGNQSRLAIQYTPYEADTILGAMIHFVPSVVDVSNNLFLLTIWDDNNGQPGNVLYEDDMFFPRSPQYHYGHNMFSYYMIEGTSIPVNGTFYIGWRQLDPERLNVGLDRNLVNNDHTFYSVDGGSTWQGSTIEGSVMIRPIFSTEMNVVLGIDEPVSGIVKSKVYPNPTENWVTIEPSSTYKGATLRNMQGQEVLKIDSTKFNMVGFPSGIYFLEIEGESTVHKISKL